MSAEPLSANQVANLVKAMETAHGGDQPKSDETVVNAQSRSAPPCSAESTTTPVKLYDFRHPDRFSNDSLQALWSLHESVAQGFATAFSELLRSPIDVSLASVTPLAYREFVSSREKPSCLGIVAPAPLPGRWLLDVTPSLAFSIIDRMLGGEPVPGETIRRPLTEIENRLMRRAIGIFLEHLSLSWRNIVALQPVLESIESAPHCAPIAAPDEPMVELAFNIKWGQNAGLVTLCMPAKSIDAVRLKLSRHHLDPRPASEPARRQIVETMDSASVNVAVTLARSKIKTSDLLGLSVGDIITTEQGIDQPLELAIQDIPKFYATAGAYNGKKAVQVQSVMEPIGRRVDDPVAGQEPPSAQLFT